MLQNDKQLSISVAGSREAVKWQPQTLFWSEFLDKLKTPVKSPETLIEYLNLPKGQQDALKDVGGFVGGSLANGRRKAGCVIGRDIITLDLDRIPAGGTEDILRRVEGLGCAYGIYSTRKHEAARPRLRVLLPLHRTATGEEYEPLARKIAEIISMDFCDPTTFQAHRLMYWPSCCSDSQYVLVCGDKPFLDTDGVLALYANWCDVSTWPQCAGQEKIRNRELVKLGDPAEKQGIIGAFCRVYDVYKAINELIPEEYEPCVQEGRYTFTGGSTAGGAIVYEDGKYLYSHHATDPAGGRLSNAFDLVRLHKFGALDENAKPDTPVSKLPSFIEMRKFAIAGEAVSKLLNRERMDKALEDFGIFVNDGSKNENNMPEIANVDTGWQKKLERAPSTGLAEPTLNNILLILDNDPLLKGKIGYDKFALRRAVLGKLPWSAEKEERPWIDPDTASIFHYFEHAYKIVRDNKVKQALSIHCEKHSFNHLYDYLNSLEWDGILRLDSLFIDYLGAEDSIYTRAVTRKAFTAAVARVMAPGTKFDTMTILSGPQGIGKSTLLKKMAKTWFTDNITTFEGKDAAEKITQGAWIVEVGELEAFNRSEIGRIKQFLSQQEDVFRAAYGEHVGWHPRRCVFFGTSNNAEYLQDRTGNRRFWAMDVGINKPTKNVFTELEDEVDQLWAEAKMRWQLGEPLYLSGAIEDIAKQEQENHREMSGREGLIIAFVEKKIPKDWYTYDLDKRRLFWAGNITGEIELVERTKICPQEVWCECFGKQQGDIKRYDVQEINSVVASLSGWKRNKNPTTFGIYGQHKGLIRE